MPGQQKTQTSQTQSSQTSPWSPSQPMLQNILSQIGQQALTPSSAATTAATNLENAAGSIPNLGGNATTAALSALGTSTAPQQGLLGSAYSTLQGELTPYANGSMLNPMSNPALKSSLDTMNQDITNQVNSQFAAAGRDLSPGNTQALARGISQGDSGVLANQYNQNVADQLGAASTLNGAGQSTASGLTAAQLAQIEAQGAGISEAGALPSLYTAPATAQLGAATTAQALPYSTLSAIEGLTTPIAALGGQSTGTMTGQTQQQSPWYTTALGGILGGAGLLGNMGAFGSNGWLTGSNGILSDVHAKEGIEGGAVEPVGELFDGQKIYAYRYKGDETPQIGLLAQEVEKVRPDAIGKHPSGLKTVDYGKATQRARIMGMLSDLQLAA